MTLDRKSASRALRRIAGLLEVRGDNIHRVRAFANASRVVERIDGDLEAMVASGEILQLKGIGKGTAGVLAELARGGTPEVLSELEGEIPEGVREMMGISGLGPKKVRAVWKDLGFSSLGELEYACRENRLVELPGFGEKTQSRLLEAIRFHRRSAQLRLINEAHAIAAEIEGSISKDPTIEKVLFSGELRRMCETVGALDLVVLASDEGAAGNAIEAGLENCRRVEPGLWTATTGDGIELEISVVREPDRAAALLWTTGSAEHLQALKDLAADRGLDLQKSGLWRDGARLDLESEEQLFQALGCAWIPPELREIADDVERATRSALPTIVEPEDFLGALHNHTIDSDGSASIEDMAVAAGKRGWAFFGVADHSPAAVYANGVSAERLRDQWLRVDDFNSAASGVRIVKGLEADILADGGLDIPEGCEEGLEYVVASVHSLFRLSEEIQTERIVNAVRHPACRVLGHPTGRLLLARPSFAVDLEQILAACAESGVAVEINASPYRLDLDWRWARRALELGVRLIVNPDAHSVDGLDDVRWGIAMARKAGATAADLVNCGDIGEFIGGR